MKKTPYQLKIISEIRDLREDNKLSQVGLSDILDVSYGMVGNIESHKFKHKYSLRMLKTICNEFGYPITKLFLPNKNLSESEQNIINSFVKNLIRYGI